MNKNIYVAFHVGHGGRFYNQGHISFEGEKTFREVCIEQNDYISPCNRDEKGRFCKSYIKDCNGTIISTDDINGNIGSLNFDGEYDTWLVREISSCSEDEIMAIIKAHEYKSDELEEFIKKNYDYLLP